MKHEFAHTVVEMAICFSIWLPAVPRAAVAQSLDLPGAVPAVSGMSRNQSAEAEARANLNSSLRIVPENFAKLKLGPGFLVRLNVLDDPDFAGQYRIDDTGNISVPVLGSLHVAGLTSEEARKQIAGRLLDGKILKDPQVSFTVLEYTAPQVTIIGEVNSPGKYPLLVPTNIVDVLALAGGPTHIAGDEVQITSADGKVAPILVRYSKSSDPQTVANVTVHAGDTVQVKRAGIVYVLGAVNRPGGYIMQEDGSLTVLQAVALANGTSKVASTGLVYLLRRNADGTGVDIAFSLKQISKGKASDLHLRPTDVLFIPTSKVKSIFTESQSIIASAASASIYAGGVY